MAQLRIRSGAAHWAALLFVAVLLSVLAAPVDAKVRLDRLWLVPSSGQEVPIDVEVAEDPKEKALGLMFRTELPDNKGMLFHYDETRELSMWMHNTYIPLDMLFIRPDGVIHRIEIESALGRAEHLVTSIEGRALSPRILELRGRLGAAVGDAPSSDRTGTRRRAPSPRTNRRFFADRGAAGSPRPGPSVSGVFPKGLLRGHLFLLAHILSSVSICRLVVGIADAVPKPLATQLLKSALKLYRPTRLICQEDKLRQLLTDLTAHRLDLVIADTPAPSSIKEHTYSHPLGESGVTLFATAKLTAQYRRGFPQSLSGAPILLPTSNAVLRRLVDHWLVNHGLQPNIVGEFDDSATLKAFGQDGYGIFPGVSVIEKEICRQYRVHVVGQLDNLKQHFYAITVERRLKHPAVLALVRTARQELLS